MGKLNMVIPHGLPQDEALRRIQLQMESLKLQFVEMDLRCFWIDDKCLFEGNKGGFSVSGMLIVKASQIEIAANLPWLAMPFKDRIEEEIRERFRNLLA